MWLKNYIMSKPLLYNLYRAVRNPSSKTLNDLLIGFYENLGNNYTLLIRNYNLMADNPLFGKINMGVDRIDHSGFCYYIRYTLMGLLGCDKLGAKPVVTWGKYCNYYDNGMDPEHNNAFEYYFEPITCQELLDDPNSRAYIELDDKLGNQILGVTSSYQYGDSQIEITAQIYKKYIRLNKKTEEYLKESIASLLSGKRVLGVHVRGTDYNLGIKDHPHVIPIDEYVTKVKELMSIGKYDAVFIATDDKNALDKFREEFGKKLLYYTDVFRSDSITGPHSMESNRPLHRYKLGLEVLRDVYTLALCNSFVCGLSQVSFAVRYINIALDRAFDELVILNRGINPDNSKIAAKMCKDLAKEQKEFQHDLHKNP